MSSVSRLHGSRDDPRDQPPASAGAHYLVSVIRPQIAGFVLLSFGVSSCSCALAALLISIKPSESPDLLQLCYKNPQCNWTWQQ